MQVSRRFIWFAACAILVGWFAHDGRAQSSVFPPPSPGASTCSATGANWLTCTISGSTLTFGTAGGQTSHKVIGTCGSATSFGPCSLVGADLPAPSGGGPPGGVAAISAATAAINTPETTVVSYTVPANTIAAGTTYRVVAYATCTSTAANVSNLRIRFGSTGTSSDTSLADLAITAATSGTNVNFRVEFIITFQSTTVAEIEAVLQNNGATGIYTAQQAIMNPANATGLTTTSNEVLQFSYGSAASTTTSTFYVAFIELVKP
jgi:hypothetical protein